MTPFQLYEWARENIPGVHFCICSTEEYERQNISLETRFEHTRMIPGTRKLHSFIPVSKETRIYSLSSDARKDHVTKLPGDLELDEVSGFVTSYNSQWWLGCGLETYSETVEISLSSYFTHLVLFVLLITLMYRSLLRCLLLIY